MKFIDKKLSSFDIKAHSLRGKNFFSGILDFREKIFDSNKNRIKEPKDFICSLCQSSDANLFLEWRDGYELYKCNACSAVSPNISVENTSEHVDQVYNNDIYYDKFLKEIHAHFDYRKNLFGSQRYEYIFDRLNLDPQKINLLDVGCGAGYFLSYLHDKNINYKGLEVNKLQVKYCQELGLNVASNDLEAENDESYDVIVMLDVLEHLFQPVSVFETAKKKLKKNGYIIAYTPNIHSVAYELMGSEQNTLLPFEHLCFYNQQSIAYLAKMTGLNLYSLETFGLDMMDYLLMKEYKDQYPYTEKLHDMMVVVQACLDKLEVSNHFRITLHNK
ncbi:hypothetical protein BVY03_03325 [bacterium K02(2017)]|nr:hypothetical protein BVY03_03325 [bacterium K02(2017)]